MELYLHYPIYPPGVVLNYAETRLNGKEGHYFVKRKVGRTLFQRYYRTHLHCNYSAL
jgi:hypothetical protein